MSSAEGGSERVLKLNYRKLEAESHLSASVGQVCNLPGESRRFKTCPTQTAPIAVARLGGYREPYGRLSVPFRSQSNSGCRCSRPGEFDRRAYGLQRRLCPAHGDSAADARGACAA